MLCLSCSVTQTLNLHPFSSSKRNAPARTSPPTPTKTSPDWLFTTAMSPFCKKKKKLTRSDVTHQLKTSLWTALVPDLCQSGLLSQTRESLSFFYFLSIIIIVNVLIIFLIFHSLLILQTPVDTCIYIDFFNYIK